MVLFAVVWMIILQVYESSLQYTIAAGSYE